MINFTLLATKAARPKKGATRKAPPPPPPKSGVPVWLWLVVIILIAGFVFLLMKLAKLEQNSPAPSVSAVQQPAAPALQPLMPPAPETQANTTAPAPEETKPKRDNFEFYQLLQNSEVDTSHVNAYQYMPRENEESYYMVQAASYRSNEDADRMRAKLILAGLQASIKVTQSAEKGTWYRLILGPYETRSDENRALDKLAKMGMNGYSYQVKKE